MSKPVNPVAIGSFTIGALLLLIIGIFIFGGGQFFKTDKIRYVVFFDSSLNGLEKGAPVKMQGVKIGEVTEIALQLDPNTGKIYKPVVIAIDRNSLTGPGGEPLPRAITHAQRIANRDKLVKYGFRARLEMQSLLTGLLYVDLDLHPNEKPLFAGLNYHGLLEIPSVPTTIDEIRNTAQEVAKKLRAMPLDQIVEDLAGSLGEIKSLLASEDVKKSRAALANTLEETEKMITTLNSNLGPLLKNTDQTIASTNALVQDFHKDIKPIMASTDKTLKAATAALHKTQESMAKVGDAVGPESAFNETLQSLNETSRSIRDLADYLERHPESLLSGKDQ